jgi:RND family efflux transporter MFP subunit
MNQVDISQLAVQRDAPTGLPVSTRKNFLTRYLLPGVLILGFLSLIAWAGRDLILPPKDVRVVPVFATQAEVRAEGSALFNAAGWIEPRPTSIRVAALANGVVEQLLVVEDQTVKAGEPVATLIKEDAQLAFDRCVADRELAEAELQRAEATLVAATTRLEQPVHLEAALAEADSNLAKIKTMLKNLPFETQRAESRLQFAKRDFDRNTSAGTRAVSQREIDQSKTEYETSKAMLQELRVREGSLKSEFKATEQRRQALRTQLKLLADELEARHRAKAQVAIGQAGVKQMKVAEAEAKLRLDRMTIKAPVDGKVYRLIGLPGARVGEGSMTRMDGHDAASIITMYQPDSLQIRVDVRFEDIPKVRLGQPVRIENAALAKPIVGSVLFISSEADIQKNTLQVKVAIDESSDFFKPEMLVDVTFLAPKQTASDTETATQELRLYLPDKLIGSHGGNPMVWVADQSSGRANRVMVTVGRPSNGGLVEIEKGLNVGSRIITSGTDGLREGDRIKVTGEDSGL